MEGQGRTRRSKILVGMVTGALAGFGLSYTLTSLYKQSDYHQTNVQIARDKLPILEKELSEVDTKIANKSFASVEDVERTYLYRQNGARTVRDIRKVADGGFSAGECAGLIVGYLVLGALGAEMGRSLG